MRLEEVDVGPSQPRPCSGLGSPRGGRALSGRLATQKGVLKMSEEGRGLPGPRWQGLLAFWGEWGPSVTGDTEERGHTGGLIRVLSGCWIGGPEGAELL